MQSSQPLYSLDASTETSSPHRISEQAEVLYQILDPGVNLSLWQRPRRVQVVEELARLRATDLPDVRCLTMPESFEADLHQLLRQQHLDPTVFAHWSSDMRQLASRYFKLSQDQPVTLRLVTTDEDNCRRFHFDRCNLRLICTYLGPGTEWLTDQQADRIAQGSGASNDEIARFGEPQRFEPFWVGIMKGDAYPGNAGRGLIHRSPSIARTGQTRVLFTLDC